MALPSPLQKGKTWAAELQRDVVLLAGNPHFSCQPAFISAPWHLWLGGSVRCPVCPLQTRSVDAALEGPGFFSCEKGDPQSSDVGGLEGMSRQEAV